jgi:hypothetical protein
MTQKLDFQLLQAIYTDNRFESMVRALDRLHDAASEGSTAELTNLPRHELIGWLKEISYLAEETIRELDSTASNADEVRQNPGNIRHLKQVSAQQIGLRLIKSKKAERSTAHVRSSGSGRGL